MFRHAACYGQNLEYDVIVQIILAVYYIGIVSSRINKDITQNEYQT